MTRYCNISSTCMLPSDQHWTRCLANVLVSKATNISLFHLVNSEAQLVAEPWQESMQQDVFSSTDRRFKSQGRRGYVISGAVNSRHVSKAGRRLRSCCSPLASTRTSTQPCGKMAANLERSPTRRERDRSNRWGELVGSSSYLNITNAYSYEKYKQKVPRGRRGSIAINNKRLKMFVLMKVNVMEST